ncbi:MAG: hypothetical protein AAB226_05690, partial [candidate division NC10 bacterium]
ATGTDVKGAGIRLISFGLHGAHRIPRPGTVISLAREPLRAVGAESVGYTLVTLAPNMASGGTLLPLI